MIDRPHFGETGRALWRVYVDPPIPRYDEDGVSISEWTSEWVVAPRHVGERIEDLSPGQNVTVNIWSYNDPRANEKPVFDSVDLTLEYVGEIASTADALPESWDPKKAWARDLARIRRFVEAHGHSRPPEPYYDEGGTRLDTVVSNIRWHHAGRGGWSEGPYPGVDYANDLVGLVGWSWEVEDAAELAKLRGARFQDPLIRSLGLRETMDETEFVRTVTTALRGSDTPPWLATRALIADKGIDVQDAAVLDLIPVRHQFGYVVALLGPEMRVFSFYLGVVGDPAEPRTWSNLAYIAEWHELIPEEARRRYATGIEIGQQLLGDAGAFGRRDG